MQTYEVGDRVELHPEPSHPDSGPHPADFDMPVPVGTIEVVLRHTANSEFILGYVFKDEADGEDYQIKPGQINKKVEK